MGLNKHLLVRFKIKSLRKFLKATGGLEIKITTTQLLSLTSFQEIALSKFIDQGADLENMLT